VASASPLDELLRDRLHFLTRLVAAEADKNKGKSSHAEVAGEDYFASSFYFGAYLVTFFDGPYSIDFVRHRSKQVRRELTHLLELLDEGPPDPASVAPIPE